MKNKIVGWYQINQMTNTGKMCMYLHDLVVIKAAFDIYKFSSDNLTKMICVRKIIEDEINHLKKINYISDLSDKNDHTMEQIEKMIQLQQKIATGIISTSPMKIVCVNGRWEQI
ncbi:MAG: hypothetical protein JKX76_01545 [Colwellia sp.]|nr:hypothetical protein [Colwellia sp.]